MRASTMKKAAVVPEAVSAPQEGLLVSARYLGSYRAFAGVIAAPSLSACVLARVSNVGGKTTFQITGEEYIFNGSVKDIAQMINRVIESDKGVTIYGIVTIPSARTFRNPMGSISSSPTKGTCTKAPASSEVPLLKIVSPNRSWL